jgi:hypothetical protein
MIREAIIGIFVGPQIRGIMKYRVIGETLSEVERGALGAFKAVTQISFEISRKKIMSH